MKNYKQAKKALLVMLAAFSILPGCGKKNDATTAAVGAVGPVQSIGNGSCATVTNGTAVTITFYGNLQTGSGLMGDLSAYGYGAQVFAGSNYYRNLTSTGDALNVYVSGNTAYATLSISANTASAIVYGQSGGYGYNGSGYAQVCGIEINESIFASPIQGNGFNGTLAGGYVKLWGNGNWITYGPAYGYAPILF